MIRKGKEKRTNAVECADLLAEGALLRNQLRSGDGLQPYLYVVGYSIDPLGSSRNFVKGRDKVMVVGGGFPV